MENSQANYKSKNVAIWLFTCCVFILLMVGIGGVTRLTQSGLSITEWKPISGILPPFSETSWQEEFTKYQQSPEYLKKNIGMNLQEFKGIFWLEFIHRLAGRLTGLVFLIPLIYFIARQQLSKNLAIRLGGIFTLGGLQGVVGWYMVKSGLRDNPHVSQYWLAFHLSMAFLIFGLVFLQALRARDMWLEKKNQSPNLQPPETSPFNALRACSVVILLAVFIQVILGAFVAGTHAGLAYNTFPDMDGKFVPDGLFLMQPWYINFFENTTTIQFTHRMWAYFVTALILVFCIVSCKFNLTKPLRYAINTLLGVVIIQVCLGIATLLYHVPVTLASIHQVFALLLLTVTIFITHELKSYSK